MNTLYQVFWKSSHNSLQRIPRQYSAAGDLQEFSTQYESLLKDGNSKISWWETADRELYVGQ